MLLSCLSPQILPISTWHTIKSCTPALKRTSNVLSTTYHADGARGPATYTHHGLCKNHQTASRHFDNRFNISCNGDHYLERWVSAFPNTTVRSHHDLFRLFITCSTQEASNQRSLTAIITSTETKIDTITTALQSTTLIHLLRRFCLFSKTKLFSKR